MQKRKNNLFSCTVLVLGKGVLVAYVLITILHNDYMHIIVCSYH